MKQMRMFEYEYTCQRCGRKFESVKLRGGLTKYCLPCSVASRRDATRLRVAKHRKAARDAVKHSQKTARANGDRLAPVGTSNRNQGRGMYANNPEPDRTNKRKRVGLD